MPNEDLSVAIKEAFASAPQGIQVLHTLEITHPLLETQTDKLDVCFVLDDTGSMGGLIDQIKTTIGAVGTGLAAAFSDVRYSLVTYKDEYPGETVIQTGATFTDLATLQTALDAVTASGGGDGPENGFGAIVLACGGLDWRLTTDVAKAIVLVTDEVSHERGATYAEALAALQANEIVFNYSRSYEDNTGDEQYEDLRAATGGVYIDSTETDEIFTAALVAALTQLYVEGTGASLYIVQDREPWTLTLEDATVVDFEAVGFRFTLPGTGQGGVQDLTISIDNVDRRITDFANLVKGSNIPVTVKYRPYLSNDTSQPQSSTPLVLTMRDLSINAIEVSGKATFADFINKKFPLELYTRKRFPGLGN